MLVYRAAADLASTGADVLDVGTKDGRHLSEIPGNVVALDVRLAPSVEGPSFIQGDGCEMPFPNDSFDIVVSNQVFEHISPDQRARMATDIARVLRPNGTFLVSAPNRYFPLGGSPHGMPPFWTFLPRSLGVPLAKRFVNRKDYEYYRDSLFPVAPWKLRDILEDAFDSVEYDTIRLGKQYGPDIWPAWFNRVFPFVTTATRIPGFKTAFESTFIYTAYQCRHPTN